MPGPGEAHEPFAHAQGPQEYPTDVSVHPQWPGSVWGSVQIWFPYWSRQNRWGGKQGGIAAHPESVQYVPWGHPLPHGSGHRSPQAVSAIAIKT